MYTIYTHVQAMFSILLLKCIYAHFRRYVHTASKNNDAFLLQSTCTRKPTCTTFNSLLCSVVRHTY